MKNSEILPTAVKKTPNNTNIEKAFFLQTDTNRQTDGRTDIKQTDTWTSVRQTFFSNKMLDAK